MPNKAIRKSEKSEKSFSIVSKEKGKQGIKKSNDHKQGGNKLASHEGS